MFQPVYSLHLLSYHTYHPAGAGRLKLIDNRSPAYAKADRRPSE
jgi:hypothetical protein